MSTREVQIADESGTSVILAALPQAPFDRVVRLAVRLLDVAIAVIGYVDPQRTVVKAVCGISKPNQLLENCGERLLQLNQGLISEGLQIFDETVSSEWLTSLPLIEEQSIRFLARIPLITREGLQVGVLCVADTVPHQRSADLELHLNDLAAIAVDAVEHQLALCQANEAENALHQAETKLLTMFSALSDSIAILDHRGRFLQVAPTESKFLYKPANELLGKSLHDVYEPTRADLFLSFIEYALSTNQTVSAEYCVPTNDGQEVWFAAKLMPLSEDTVLWVAKDISDREFAEEVLEESAAQIRLIIDSVPTRIAYVDQNLRYRFVNRPYEEWFHCQTHEIVGKHIQELLGAERYQANLPYIQTALEGETVYFQDSLPSIDGVENFFQVTYVPHFGKQNEVLGYYVMAQDITDHKRTEEILRRSEAEIRTLFAAIPDVILVFDSNGRYLKIAPTSPELLYRSADELLGKTIHDVFPPERANACQSLIHQALAENRMVSTEYSLQIGDRETWFSGNISPLTHDSVLLVARDITQQKRVEADLRMAETKYRNFFENAVVGIFQTSPEGRYLCVNSTLARMHGFDSPAEMIESLTDIGQQLYVDSDRRQAFIQSLQSQDAVFSFESEVYCKDGSTIWVSENVRAVHDSNGNLLYYEGISTDITAQKR